MMIIDNTIYTDDDDLYNYTQDELIDIILNQEDYIAELQCQVATLKKEKEDKINKDFEDNKRLIGTLINNLVD